MAWGGDAKACGYLATGGTIVAAIKGSHENVSHCVASEVNSPKPSAPPEAI